MLNREKHEAIPKRGMFAKKADFFRVLLLVLLIVSSSLQAWFLLSMVFPQREALHRYGLYETLFFSSEITILSFELVYLFLYLYGLLRKTVSPGVDQAKRITALLFAAFLFFQTLLNTFNTSFESRFLLFLAGKNLCSLVLFLVIAYADCRVSGIVADGIKPALTAMLPIFTFFYSVYIFFAMKCPFPFIQWMGYLHLFFAFTWIFFSISPTPEKKKKILGRVRRGLCILVLGMTALYSLVGIPLCILSWHHRALTVDCTLDEVDNILLNADAGDKNVIVCENEDFYFFFPLYRDIRFATGSLPSKADEKNIMVIPTTFTHAFEIGFSHDNIEGIHVDAGILYQGSNLKDAGAFTFANRQAELWNSEEAEEALYDAAEQGGCGYQQYLLLENGEIVDSAIMNMVGCRCCRAITKWKGRLCILDTKHQMTFREFCEMLHELGVEDTIYCDMGMGWNYSWYRQNNGNAKNLFGYPWPFSHAWLVFRK